MQTLQDAIEESKYILDLEEDWDGEGSPPPTKENYEMGILFIKGLNRIALMQTNKDMWAPDINPCGTTIDFVWHTPYFECLVNYDVSGKDRLGWYWWDKQGKEDKGEIFWVNYEEPQKERLKTLAKLLTTGR